MKGEVLATAKSKNIQRICTNRPVSRGWQIPFRLAEGLQRAHHEMFDEVLYIGARKSVRSEEIISKIPQVVQGVLAKTTTVLNTSDPNITMGGGLSRPPFNQGRTPEEELRYWRAQLLETRMKRNLARQGTSVHGNLSDLAQQVGDLEKIVGMKEKELEKSYEPTIHYEQIRRDYEMLNQKGQAIKRSEYEMLPGDQQRAILRKGVQIFDDRFLEQPNQSQNLEGPSGTDSSTPDNRQKDKEKKLNERIRKAYEGSQDPRDQEQLRLVNEEEGKSDNTESEGGKPESRDWWWPGNW